MEFSGRCFSFCYTGALFCADIVMLSYLCGYRPLFSCSVNRFRLYGKNIGYIVCLTGLYLKLGFCGSQMPLWLVCSKQVWYGANMQGGLTLS